MMRDENVEPRGRRGSSGGMGVDPKSVRRQIVDWLKIKVAEAGARGIVVGLSGGIDSAVVAGLAKEAFPEATVGVWMPSHSLVRDAEDAAKVAKAFGIPMITVDLTQAWDLLTAQLAAAVWEGNPPRDQEAFRMAEANVKPRLRMITLHYIARAKGYLVAGTGNRTELTVGYFTKYGDGGVDLLPIGGLVKSEVRALARELGVPAEVIDKPPSAGLWEGQTDEGEMGLTYDELDRYILTGEASPEVKERIERMIRQSEHKRRMPPVAEIARS